ncbi:MAG: gas vesicle protein K [Chloroflexi bacterium]|nr:gas vesicle protein K [Chloroflexota bacterium]
MTALTVRGQHTTLLDLLDRLLDKGVVVAGDLTISVAEVDLLFASVRLVVTSVDKMWESAARSEGPPQGAGPPGDSDGRGDAHWDSEASLGQGRGKPDRARAEEIPVPPRPAPGSALGIPSPLQQEETPEKGWDPDEAADGLVRLVLTLVELLRRLLEREALRRMERGTLTPEEMERLGRAFLRMEQRIGQIRERFHLNDEDLNLDLGPLGRLM